MGDWLPSIQLVDDMIKEGSIEDRAMQVELVEVDVDDVVRHLSVLGEPKSQLAPS